VLAESAYIHRPGPRTGYAARAVEGGGEIALRGEEKPVVAAVGAHDDPLRIACPCQSHHVTLCALDFDRGLNAPSEQCTSVWPGASSR
jgi:hypothetical protein